MGRGRKAMWKVCRRFRDPIRVSPEGQVEICRDGVWSPLRPFVGGGSMRVYVHKKGGGHTTLIVPRLVAAAWLGLPRGCVVTHRNGDRRDNRAENLEVVPSREACRRGGEMNCKPVRKLNAMGETVAVYHSIREAAKANGCSEVSLSERARGLRKHASTPDGFRYVLGG